MRGIAPLAPLQVPPLPAYQLASTEEADSFVALTNASLPACPSPLPSQLPTPDTMPPLVVPPDNSTASGSSGSSSSDGSGNGGSSSGSSNAGLIAGVVVGGVALAGEREVWGGASLHSGQSPCHRIQGTRETTCSSLIAPSRQSQTHTPA